MLFILDRNFVFVKILIFPVKYPHFFSKISLFSLLSGPFIVRTWTYMDIVDSVTSFLSNPNIPKDPGTVSLDLSKVTLDYESQGEFPTTKRPIDYTSWSVLRVHSMYDRLRVARVYHDPEEKPPHHSHRLPVSLSSKRS